MPSRNIVKQYDIDSYYHVYNRGVNKQKIFLDEEDFRVFLSLLKRYLSDEKQSDKYGRVYENYHDELELICFCLMSNHYHLLFYQNENLEYITKLMRNVTTAYSMYFNKKYQRVGPLFQGNYKASKINDESYLLHVTRYIHLNPKNYTSYSWSSYNYFINNNSPRWLKTDKAVSLFDGPEDYKKFVNDYKDYQETLEELKFELTNDISAE